MRQMDTILVAVGVPTKEVPGASFALLQSATKDTPEIPDQTNNEQQVTKTQNPVESADTSTETNRELPETEELGEGWDIPDISDLLDSLNDTESDGQIKIQNNLSLASEEDTTSDAIRHQTADSNAQCDSSEEADQDSEHISWSWDDTHWTTECSHENL